MKYKFLLIGLLIFISSCKSSFKSYKDGVVSLYDGQAHLMNGTYFIDPFYHSDEYKELQELFGIKDAYKYLEKIEFEFLSDEKLKLTYSNGLTKKTKLIKGKLTKGGFQIDGKLTIFGIPSILFSYIEKREIFYLGNDDDLIYQNFHKSANHLFGRIQTREKSEIIKFDRQLPN